MTDRWSKNSDEWPHRCRDRQWFSTGRTMPRPVGDLDSIHGFLGPRERVSLQTARQSVQPFLQWSRTWLTDKQADTSRPRYSVCSNQPHLAIAAMVPNNNYERRQVVVGGADRWEGRLCRDGDEPATDVHDRRVAQHCRRPRSTQISAYT